MILQQKTIFFHKLGRYTCIFLKKKIKNGYYSGGFGQKNATKYHFFVKKRAMGARKFPLTILSTKKVRSMVGIWGQKNLKNKSDFEKNSSIIGADE